MRSSTLRPNSNNGVPRASYYSPRFYSSSDRELSRTLSSLLSTPLYIISLFVYAVLRGPFIYRAPSIAEVVFILMFYYGPLERDIWTCYQVTSTAREGWCFGGFDPRGSREIVQTMALTVGRIIFNLGEDVENIQKVARRICL